MGLNILGGCTHPVPPAPIDQTPSASCWEKLYNSTGYPAGSSYSVISMSFAAPIVPPPAPPPWAHERQTAVVYHVRGSLLLCWWWSSNHCKLLGIVSQGLGMWNWIWTANPYWNYLAGVACLQRNVLVRLQTLPKPRGPYSHNHITQWRQPIFFHPET